MNDDTTLLQEVYHSAYMGERGTQLMLGKSKDGGLSAKLSELGEEYAAIREQAAEKLTSYGQQPKDSSAIENTAQWLGVQIGTLTDSSPSRMAEMMISGSADMMIDSIEDIKRNHQAQHHTRQLAGRLVKLETDSFNTMKTYLS